MNCEVIVDQGSINGPQITSMELSSELPRDLYTEIPKMMNSLNTNS